MFPIDPPLHYRKQWLILKIVQQATILKKVLEFRSEGKSNNELNLVVNSVTLKVCVRQNIQ